MVSVRELHGSRTLSELSGLGNKTKENVLFTAETQDDFFFLFPPPSLTVRYEFLNISKLVYCPGCH